MARACGRWLKGKQSGARAVSDFWWHGMLVVYNRSTGIGPRSLTRMGQMTGPSKNPNPSKPDKKEPGPGGPGGGKGGREDQPRPGGPGGGKGGREDQPRTPGGGEKGGRPDPGRQGGSGGDR